MTRIGVISDTHDYLDPAIPRLFKGVDHILHGGDIGMPWLISQLEAIAPVTAVLGNTDEGIALKETEVLRLAGRKFLIHHIVDVAAPSEKLKSRLQIDEPDVVVFGHTHRRYCGSVGQTLYFNPGYAGRPRFDLQRSVAILRCEEGRIEAEFVDL
ncbi:MAG: metallophosphoesterase family protein [Verrucomicrobia bacterium]|nr:metallophosphoesterase family protein [Verrucomicrobiota bacterium]